MTGTCGSLVTPDVLAMARVFAADVVDQIRGELAEPPADFDPAGVWLVTLDDGFECDHDVAPLRVAVEGVDDLEARIRRYAGPHLPFSDFEVELDLVTGRGAIRYLGGTSSFTVVRDDQLGGAR